MDLQGPKQWRKPFALGLEGGRPGGVVIGELDESITDTGAREVPCGGGATVGLTHGCVVSQTILAIETRVVRSVE